MKMTLPNQPEPPQAEFSALETTASEIGANPMLIQAAGGNVSLKDGEVMWIKASGTLLAEAKEKNIFVAVDLPLMRAALASGDPHADTPVRFLLPGGSGLRPSIETGLHAIFAHKVVIHAHCVHTLAHAVLADGENLLGPALKGINWAFVPYIKPGAKLARSVEKKLDGNVDVVVLGNHGLIVAGQTVEQARALLNEVHSRLAVAPAANGVPDLEGLAKIIARQTRYILAQYSLLHQLALDPDRVRQAVWGSLYPDHVIFCGIGATALEKDETLEHAVRRVVETGAPPPVFLIVPGQGVLVINDASAGACALMRCLVDVLVRVPSSATLRYLTPAQNLELLDWDAEKYRKALNAE